MQLSDDAREQLRNEGLRINDRIKRLERLIDAIEYGRSQVAKYRIETRGELPEEDQLEFARLWANATGGGKSKEN